MPGAVPRRQPVTPPPASDPRVWQLFASALADRALVLGPGQPEAAGRLAWPGADAAEADADARAALRLRVLRQVVAQQPGGRWAIDEAALTAARLWGPRAVPAAPKDTPDDALVRCLASWPRPVLLRRAFTVLEAARVEAQLARQFPGVRADLARAPGATAARGVWAARLNRLAAEAPQLADADATALDSLRCAIRWTARQAEGGATGRAAPGGLPMPALAEQGSDSSAPGGTGTNDPAHTDPTHTDPTHTNQAHTNQADTGQAEGLGDTAAATASAHPGAQAERRRLAAAPGPALAPPPVARQSAAAPGLAPDPVDRPVASVRAAPPGAAGARASAPASASRSQWHDEWDCTATRYRRAWTCVRVQAVHAAPTDYLARLQARHAPLMRAIRRHFSATPPTARARGGPAADGDQIDLDQALAHLVDQRAGGQAEARPYRHRPRLQRDVCTAVLLDTSGSTGFTVPPPHDPSAPPPPPPLPEDDDDGLLYGFRPRRGAEGPAPRRVIDIAHDAIALMCDGLQLLGDRHAIYGFSGQGRLNVAVKVAKGFDEPWSARTASALAALQPEGSTRTGAAIRFAVSQLLPQPAHTRVLVLVTDGYPQDQDYGPDPNDRAYGLHDTAQALREAARAGVAAFCISVDQAAHDYLRGVCPAHRYLVIDDIHRLPERLSRLYRRLTSV